MKKLLIFLFSVLLLSSLCYAAEQAPVAASSDQTKATENKKQTVTKKSVKSKSKKVVKKVKKAVVEESTKK